MKVKKEMPDTVKTCKCGNTEFEFDYKANVNPLAIKFGIVSGHVIEIYTCTKCGEKYRYRKGLE